MACSPCPGLDCYSYIRIWCVPIWCYCFYVIPFFLYFLKLRIIFVLHLCTANLSIWLVFAVNLLYKSSTVKCSNVKCVCLKFSENEMFIFTFPIRVPFNFVKIEHRIFFNTWGNNWTLQNLHLFCFFNFTNFLLKALCFKLVMLFYFTNTLIICFAFYFSIFSGG